VPEWWTDTDAAELDLLTYELVRAIEAHYPVCPECQPREWCPVLRAAVDVVVDWRQARMLASRADWLRARLELDQLRARAQRLLEAA